MSNTDLAMQLEYALVDVFAERPLEGNPLAIFADARGLSDAQMQALARETNLSETTFVLPADAEAEAREGVRVRIFTTDGELPFAGHPTLGTASWLHGHHPRLRGAGLIRLLLNAGTVEVRFPELPDGASGPGVVATMRQGDAIFGGTHPREAVAEALALPVEAISTRLPIQTVSTGLPFCLVPVVSVEAMAELRTSRAATEGYLRGTGARFFYLVAPDGDGFRARMQFHGVEDPATGSAAGCAAAWLVRYGLAASAAPVVIRQGVEMGRPSRITAQATAAGQTATEVFVSGRTIPVASGRFLRPW